MFSSIPAFFIFIFCVFGSFCEYENPKIEYKYIKFQNITITSTQLNCGALDGGASPDEYYKTIKLFNSISILYQGIEENNIDTFNYIKINSHE